MPHTTRSFASSLAFLLALGALALGTAAPARAATWPFGPMLHLHPGGADQQDSRLTVQIYNQGGLVQQVRVAGRIYTLLPHDRLTLKAPEGTEVYAASKGFRHRKGDLLFAFTPERNGAIVPLD